MQHQPFHPTRPPSPARARRTAAAIAAVIAIALALAACGGGSDDASDLSTAPGDRNTGGGAARTVDVVMRDNAFSPASVEVAAGETVTFAFRNDGAVTHDAVIGDEAAQAEHEDEMRAAEAGD